MSIAVEQVVENSTNTAGTSHTINLPTATANQLLLIILDKGSSSGISVNSHSSLTELLDETLANGLYIAYRFMDGSEPSSYTLTTSGSVRTASLAYRISGASRTKAPDIGTTNPGSGTTPDPPASTTPNATREYLFLAFGGMAGEEADDDTWGNSSPANYTPSPPRQKSCGTAGTNLGGLILAAERLLSTGSAENPGTFGVDTSAAWRTQTIMIFPHLEISCDPGSYTETGAAATVVAERVISSDPGSYAETGFDASIAKSFFLSVDPGSYAETGLDSTLFLERTVLADPGAFSETGIAASIVRDVWIDANPSSYNVVVAGDSPDSWWKLNEASGTFVDSGSGAHNGTEAGSGMVRSKPGLIVDQTQKCIDISGGARVSIGNFYHFAGTAAFTAEAWINFDTFDTSFRRIFFNEATDANGRQGWTSWYQDNGTTKRFGFERWIDGVGTGAAVFNSGTGGVTLATGTTYHVVVGYNGTQTFIYVNGVAGTFGNSSGSLKDISQNLYLGASNSGGNPVDGRLDQMAIYSRALSSTEILEHYQHGINDASIKTFAYAGVAASLIGDRVVVGSPGAYAETGIDASVVASKIFSADPGSYTETGFAASVVAGRVLFADPGVYAFTGSVADLVHTTSGAYSLTVDPGAFTFVGQSASLISDRVVVVDPATYAFTGASAGVVAGRAITVDPGSYVLVGFDATLLHLIGEKSIDAMPGVLLISTPEGTLVWRGVYWPRHVGGAWVPGSSTKWPQHQGTEW